MPSKLETVEKSLKVRKLKKLGMSDEQIKKKIKNCSSSLIREYLEKNSHGPTCNVCGGIGVSKDYASGKLRPLCTKP